MTNQADDPQAESGLEDVGAGDSTGATAGDGSEEITVVGTATALEAEEFPQGLSPRELSLTLRGQLLGHFHLQEFIGGGGMGAVFKALDTTLDRIVAVKVVASQSISNEDLQRRFLVEAQSTARLDHPNIARIHYVGRDRGLPYIVFEYIDGVNLRDLITNHGPIPLGDALSFTCQIAHALAHAWEKEVVHRDIKPSNILITRDGQAKLVDMGLARLHQVDTTDDELTNTGVTLGTFDYISPEQARDPREVDTRSDIYSLGCTLFYMLVGRPPFAEGTAVQKLLKHQDQEPPSLSQVRPDLPESVSKLASSMLAKSPELRPQTPTELLQRCYQICQELGIQPPSTLTPIQINSPAQVVSPWSMHLPWIVPIVLLLLVAMLWESGLRDASDSVEFTPLRRPAEAQMSDVTQQQEGRAKEEGEDRPRDTIDATGSSPTESATASEAATDTPIVTPDWLFYSPQSSQPFQKSILDFSSSEILESEDVGEFTGDTLNLDEIIIQPD